MNTSKKNEIWKFVAGKTGRLAHMHEAGYTSGDLSVLRTGAGKKPGDAPGAMGIVLEGMPVSFMDRYGDTTPEEWSVYTAVTLYALHQRGHSHSVITHGQSLGRAYRIALSNSNTANADEVFTRKMTELGRAHNIQHLAMKLSTVISWLSSKGAGLDFAGLATDLYEWQTATGRGRVLMRWAQDYNRKPEKSEKTTA